MAISAAAVLWAVGGSTASYLAGRGASVLELAEARAWIAVVGIGGLLFVKRGRGLGGPAPAVPWLVVPFGLSIAAANLSYYMSVSLLPVAVAIVVQYTAPGLIVVWAAGVQGRRPSGRVLLALLVTLVGVALLSEAHVVVSGGGSRLDPRGLAFAGVASLSFAVYVIVGERLGRELGADRAVFSGFVVASVFWLGVQAFRGLPDTLLDSRFAAWVLFLGVASTIMPFLLFVWGMKGIDASRAGVASTLEPLSAAAIAYVWLGQSLSAVQLAGAAMVVAGIVAVQLERPPPPDEMPRRAAVE